MKYTLVKENPVYKKNLISSGAAVLMSASLMACSAQNQSLSLTAGTVNPSIWPTAQSPVGIDPKVESEITTIMEGMTLRHKVGQVIQGDIGSLTPEDLKVYPLGSVLNGGNSAPNGDNRSPASDWIKLADEFYEASKDAYGEGVPFIPLLWGTDAVHGHNNVPGATVFPHNIGLGATRNPALMRKIGEITAKEIRVGGQEWTFAPTIAVVRDDRWGRTYEGYSENPDVTVSYAGELIKGIQGEPDSENWLKGNNVIATAKHFLGDGGTTLGIDQGDNADTEEELRDRHGAAYPVAINAGAQSVMASFSSWQGVKLHGHKGLLTDVLKGQMGFDGFIVGDWNGHGQLDGCTVESCPAALHAGLDMYMAPDSWRGLFENTLKQAENGEIDLDRLDDAVRRILRVKIRSGLMSAGKPSERPGAADYDVLKDPVSKEVARQAVRESQVLIKNNGILPLSPKSTILVAGDGADNIGKQSGGWTLSWQGTGNENSDFPGGTSFLDGITRHLNKADGQVILADADGNYSGKPSAAIVVFGEEPYAEFKGDRDNLAYKPGDDSDLLLLKKFKSEGIPTVAIFLTGRPLWMNREINSSDAFVAAWLPGSEGGYATDLLFTNSDGETDFDFVGKLPYSWPKIATQTSLNYDDENYEPLFAYGYGLSYSNPGNVGVLSENAGIDLKVINDSDFFKAGKAMYPWTMTVSDEFGETVVKTSRDVSPGKIVSIYSTDDGVQENTRTINFNGEGKGAFAISKNPPANLTRQNTADMAIYMRVRFDDLDPEDKLSLSVDCGVNCSKPLALDKASSGLESSEWVELSLKLSCFAAASDMEYVNSAFLLETSDALSVSISDVKLVSNEGDAICID